MSIYAPAVTLISLIGALFIRLKTENSLLWIWSAILTGALPATGFVCFSRPFSILAGRLMRQGSAVSGWNGTELLSKAYGVILHDGDVFPEKQLKFGGIKIYDNRTMSEAVGYAAAVIEESGSGLNPVFQELRSTNNGRMFRVSQFKRYEGGGYGAEIAGDVVLVGSLRFMQLMGVYMHEGTRVNDAVYLSINGELCAVFAVKHAPAPSIRKALHQIIASSGLTPVFATRDFLLTPQMLAEKFRVSGESLEFPSAADRDRLAVLPEGCETKQGAIMTKQGFGTFSEIAAGGRLLKTVSGIAMGISIAGGLVGLALMLVLTALGAVRVVTGLNLLIFEIVWAIPALLIAGWMRRY